MIIEQKYFIRVIIYEYSNLITINTYKIYDE